MTRRTMLWAAVASAALAFAPRAGLAAEVDTNIALFGKDPGAGKAYACYVRHYDAAHLASHPKQNVRDMLLFVNSYVDSDSGRQYSLGMGVTFRKVKTMFQVDGGCGSSVDGSSALNCGIDCDGGRIDVSVKDANAILVSVPDGARTWDAESEDEPPAGAQFGEDDKLFRLDRTGLADCLPLISDDDIKAEIGPTQ